MNTTSQAEWNATDAMHLGPLQHRLAFLGKDCFYELSKYFVFSLLFFHLVIHSLTKLFTSVSGSPILRRKPVKTT